MANVYVGTAGYNYAWWRKGAFYPRGLAQSSELKHFSGIFSAVEINASFHGVPRIDTLKTWAGQAKPGFKFAFKAPQDITHVKRLSYVDDAVKFFINRVQETLGDALGPILFQLPPSLPVSVAKLDEIAAILPPGVRVAWEFRHASWYCDEVYAALRKHNFALCENRSVDNSTHHTTVETADFCYTRFHKNGDQTVTDWPTPKLKEAAVAIADRRKRGLEQYLFFMNDHEANGPKNAQTLMKEVSALIGDTKLVQGWKPDTVVTKGGKGSIQAMFAGAAKPKRSTMTTPPTVPAASAAPATTAVSDVDNRAAKRVKVDQEKGGHVSTAHDTSGNTPTKSGGKSPTKSPSKSPTKSPRGNILNFFGKKDT
eukprot:m.224477 g.224477  ORF g.224477 m.224477 type:complete len:369 (-) comp34278_c0_seq1:97-1203(-)